MSTQDKDIPEPTAHRDGEIGVELSPEQITPVNHRFYTLVVGGLLLALLFGMVSWFVLTVRGDEMPEGLAVLTASIGGGLVGLLTQGGKR